MMLLNFTLLVCISSRNCPLLFRNFFIEMHFRIVFYALLLVRFVFNLKKYRYNYNYYYNYKDSLTSLWTVPNGLV